jgi:hypothetical protein
MHRLHAGIEHRTKAVLTARGWLIFVRVVEFRSRGANCGHLRRLSTSPHAQETTAGVASCFTIRPEMYVGIPITAERAVVFIEGNGLALAVATGRLSEISKFHELLYPPTSYPVASAEGVIQGSNWAYSAERPACRRPGTTLTKDITSRSSRPPLPEVTTQRHT